MSYPNIDGQDPSDLRDNLAMPVRQDPDLISEFELASEDAPERIDIAPVRGAKPEANPEYAKEDEAPKKKFTEEDKKRASKLMGEFLDSTVVIGNKSKSEILFNLT